MNILPICDNIPVRTYLYHALYNSIICTRKELNPYLFNQFIQLVFFKDKSLPDISLDYYYIKAEYSDIFEKEIASKETLSRNKISVKEYLINALNSNYYSIVYLNEYYIPNRGSYDCPESRYYMHESLIYGVDEEKKIFYSIAYNESYTYKKCEIPFKNLEKGFNDTQENNKLYLLKINDFYTDYEIDVNVIFKRLKEYYYSINSYEDNKIINTLGVLGINRKDFLNAEYGLNAINATYNYIQQIIDKTAIFDIRCFFLLKEHKKLMVMRLEYLLSNNILKGIENIINEYKLIDNYSTIIFNLLIKYSLKHNIDYLNSMKNYVALIYKSEKQVLEVLIEKLERHVIIKS